MEQFFWDILSRWSHLGLFGVLMAAGFGLPLPEDIPLVLAGVIVHQADGDQLQPLFWIMLTGLAGVLAGDSCLFWIGRIYGQDVLNRKWIQRFAKPWLVAKAQQKFEGHGAKILFAARFMPGLRAIMFLIAGTFRLPYWKLLAFDGSAALISVPAWIWAGWYFPSKIEAIFSNAKIATYVVIGILALALIAWGVYEYLHNLRKRQLPVDGRQESEEIAPISTMPGNALAPKDEIGMNKAGLSPGVGGAIDAGLATLPPSTPHNSSHSQTVLPHRQQVERGAQTGKLG